MTGVLWAVFGMTIGAAVLHAALGLARPLDRTYLSFAGIMAMLAGFVFFELELYRSTTSEQAIDAFRYQVVAAHGLLAFVFVFVPAYTRVRVPRWLIATYATGLALLFITNLLVPYGIWFNAQPQLYRSTFAGEPYTVVVAPPLSILQFIHTLYVLCVFAFAFTCAIKLVRAGERRRGAMLAIGLVAAVFDHGVDVMRDAIGGGWPYVAPVGLVTWGLLMSVQLAIDFRVSEQRLSAMLDRAEQHTAELASIVDATLRVRDKLNTPLQTLELSLAMRTAARFEDEQTLAELRRAVAQLTQLGHAVERTADHRSDPKGGKP